MSTPTGFIRIILRHNSHLAASEPPAIATTSLSATSTRVLHSSAPAAAFTSHSQFAFSSNSRCLQFYSSRQRTNSSSRYNSRFPLIRILHHAGAPRDAICNSDLSSSFWRASSRYPFPSNSRSLRFYANAPSPARDTFRVPLQFELVPVPAQDTICVPLQFEFVMPPAPARENNSCYPQFDVSFFEDPARDTSSPSLYRFLHEIKSAFPSNPRSL